MEEKKIYKIQGFKKDDYMVWHVCSQCASTAEIIFKDDTKEYFRILKKDSSSNIQHLGQGGAFYTGGKNLRIELKVTFPNVKQQSSINNFGVSDTEGVLVGSGYNICIEDSVDNDFNDYYFNIVAWNKKG